MPLNMLNHNHTGTGAAGHASLAVVMSSPHGMTIDELARRTEMTTRKLRLYQTKGLLQSPTIVGRTGYYSEDHLKRLLMIERLQKRGFSLTSIGELIERSDKGEAIAQLLGLEQALGTPFSEETPVVMTVPQLAEKLGKAVDEAIIDRAVEVGLVERQDDGVKVLMPTVLDFGAELVKRGIPILVALDELGNLRQVTVEVVQRFAKLFQGHVLPRVLESGPDSMLTNLAGLASQLRTAMPRVFVAIMHQAVDAHVANFQGIPGLGGDSD